MTTAPTDTPSRRRAWMKLYEQRITDGLEHCRARDCDTRSITTTDLTLTRIRYNLPWSLSNVTILCPTHASAYHDPDQSTKRRRVIVAWRLDLASLGDEEDARPADEQWGRQATETAALKMWQARTGAMPPAPSRTRITVEDPEHAVRVVVQRLADGWVRTVWVGDYPLAQDPAGEKLSAPYAALWAIAGVKIGKEYAREALHRAKPSNRSYWLDEHSWADPDCVECDGSGAPCCEPPDHPYAPDQPA